MAGRRDGAPLAAARSALRALSDAQPEPAGVRQDLRADATAVAGGGRQGPAPDAPQRRPEQGRAVERRKAV